MLLYTWQSVRLFSSLYANTRNLQTPYYQKAILVLFFYNSFTILSKKIIKFIT